MLRKSRIKLKLIIIIIIMITIILKIKLNLWLTAPEGATPLTRLLQPNGRYQYDGII